MRTHCRPLIITPRERHALQLLAAGLTVEGVTADLGLGALACETLLARLFAALGAATAAEAIDDAGKRGLLTDSKPAGVLRRSDRLQPIPRTQFTDGVRAIVANGRP
jgi:hypothetical protein